jgi:predicted enzyme related to lactoylglutathione lyase
MTPTVANGKICYIEIPATDIARSADFHGKVFGGATARFRDPGGNVIGLYQQPG